jgi:molecular chaperone DnaJ
MFGGGSPFGGGGAHFGGGSPFGGGGGGGLNDILGSLFGSGSPMGGGQQQYADPYAQQQRAPQPAAKPAPPKPVKIYKITYAQAVKGVTLAHTSKAGKKIKFKVPEGTPSGKRLKVGGELIEIVIKVPKYSELTPEEQGKL